MGCLHRPQSFLHRRKFFTGIHLLLISHSKQRQLDRHSSLKANPDAEDKPPEYDRQKHRKLIKTKRTACRLSITIAEIKAVTPEQVKQAAQRVTLDTVYFLQGEEAQADA